MWRNWNPNTLLVRMSNGTSIFIPNQKYIRGFLTFSFTQKKKWILRVVKWMPWGHILSDTVRNLDLFSQIPFHYSNLVLSLRISSDPIHPYLSTAWRKIIMHPFTWCRRWKITWHKPVVTKLSRNVFWETDNELIEWYRHQMQWGQQKTSDFKSFLCLFHSQSVLSQCLHWNSHMLTENLMYNWFESKPLSEPQWRVISVPKIKNKLQFYLSALLWLFIVFCVSTHIKKFLF